MEKKYDLTEAMFHNLFIFIFFIIFRSVYFFVDNLYLAKFTAERVDNKMKPFCTVPSKIKLGSLV